MWAQMKSQNILAKEASKCLLKEATTEALNTLPMLCTQQVGVELASVSQALPWVLQMHPASVAKLLLIQD